MSSNEKGTTTEGRGGTSNTLFFKHRSGHTQWSSCSS